MVGWMAIAPETRRWKPCPQRVRVCGLPLLQIEVPPVRAGRERRGLRRLARAAQALFRAGCRRVLTEPDFPYWNLLNGHGLEPVSAEGLCRTLAAPLALCALARRGIPPASATAALYARRVDRAYFQAAAALCPQVRQLILHAPDGGLDLADCLRAEYGVAVLETETEADITICFTQPEITIGNQNRLLLSDARPDLNGLTIMPDPEHFPKGWQETGLDFLPLAALLWEEGRITAQDLFIC